MYVHIYIDTDIYVSVCEDFNNSFTDLLNEKLISSCS